MATRAQQIAEIARLQSGGRRLSAISVPRIDSANYDVLVKDSRGTYKNQAPAGTKAGKWKRYVIGAGAGQSQAVFT